MKYIRLLFNYRYSLLQRATYILVIQHPLLMSRMSHALKPFGNE